MNQLNQLKTVIVDLSKSKKKRVTLRFTMPMPKAFSDILEALDELKRKSEEALQFQLKCDMKGGNKERGGSGTLYIEFWEKNVLGIYEQ